MSSNIEETKTEINQETTIKVKPETKTEINQEIRKYPNVISRK